MPSQKNVNLFLARPLRKKVSAIPHLLEAFAKSREHRPLSFFFLVLVAMGTAKTIFIEEELSVEPLHFLTGDIITL